MRKVIFPIFAVIIGLAACSAPKKTVRKTTVLPVERILKKVEANRRKIKTFEATGVIKIKSPKYEGKGNIEITIKRPDSLRISVFGPFGISVAEALITKDKFYYYDALRNKLYYGKNKRKIIERIFKFDLPFDDVSNLLIGRVNLTGKIYEKPLQVKADENSFELFYQTGNSLTEKFEFSREDNKLLSYGFGKGNEKIFNAHFENFKKYGKFELPLILNLKYKSETNLKIDYRNVKVNDKIESLSLDIPKDAKKIEW